MASGNEELIDKYVDRTGWLSDTKFATEQLQTILDKMKEISAFKLRLGSAEGQFEGGKIAKQAADAMDAMANANKKLDESFAKNSGGAKQQVSALRELIEASNKNVEAQKALLKSKKDLDAAFNSGKITTQQYAVQLADIEEKELALKIESDLLNQELREIEKQALAAEGSLSKLNTEVKETGKSFDEMSDAEKEAAAVNEDLSNSYQELFTRLQQIKGQKAEIKTEITAVNKAYESGQISIEEYQRRTAQLNLEFDKLDVEGKKVQAGLKGIAQNSQASEGSLNSLRAQLKLANQAFDDMSAAERKSAKGDDLLQKIQTLDAATKELEFSSGRFGRNVGNYEGAAKTIVTALKQVEDEVSRLTVKQKELQGVQDLTNRRTVVGGFRTGGSGASAQTTRELKDVNAQLGFAIGKSQALNKIVNDPRFLKIGSKTGSTKDELKFFQQAMAQLEKAGLRNTEVYRGLQGQIGKLSNQMAATKGSVDGLSNRLSNLATTFLATIGVVGVGSFFSSSIDEFVEMDKVTRILKNTLSNLGIPEAFGRIETASKRLQNQFKFLDDDDILKVFNDLIVFGKLTEDQINELIPVIIDFAAATGKDLASATGDVIKAIEGNGRELKKFGINMKDAKSTTEGFALIMSELAPKVKGVGEAFGESAAGGLAAAKQEFKDLKEEMGSGLLPMLNRVLKSTLEAIDNIRTFGRAISAQFKGNSGFIQIALDEVQNNPVLVEAVETSTKEIVASVTGAQKQIEQQLGRELNLKGKEDAKLLKDNQDLRIQGIRDALKRDETDLAGLIKSGSRQDQQEARSLKISILARTQAIKDLTTTVNEIKPTGDPDKPRGGTPKADNEKNSALELFKFRLNLIIEENKKISEVELLSAQTRIQALQRISEAEKQIIEADSEDQLKQTGLSAKKILEIKKQLNEALTQEDQQRIEKQFNLTDTQILLFEKAVDAEIKTNDRLLTGVINIQQTVKQKIKDEIAALKSDLDTTSDKLRADEQKKHQERLDDAKKFLEQRLTSNQTNSDKELEALNIQFKKGTINKKKFEEEKTRIEKLAIKANLEAQLDYFETILKLQAEFLGRDSDEVKKLVAEIARLKKELSGITVGASTEDAISDLEDFLGKVKEIFDTATGLISDFFGALADKQKNEIEEQINLIEQRTAKEIESINQTTQNKVEAEAKISIVEKRAAAQKALLEQRQRQADIQRAQFEKAANIASISIQTALNVVKAAGSAPPPFNLPAIIGAAALGAAQLAVAIATPIPKFREGKGHFDTYEGPAVVGDGGKAELIERSDGSMEVTPNKPTHTWVDKDDIIHPDAQKALKKMDEKNMDKSHDKSLDIVSERSLDKSNEFDKSSEKEADKITDQLQSVEKISITENVKDRISDKSIDKVSEKSSDKFNEIGTDKVGEQLVDGVSATSNDTDKTTEINVNNVTDNTQERQKELEAQVIKDSLLHEIEIYYNLLSREATTDSQRTAMQSLAKLRQEVAGMATVFTKSTVNTNSKADTERTTTNSDTNNSSDASGSNTIDKSVVTISDVTNNNTDSSVAHSKNEFNNPDKTKTDTKPEVDKTTTSDTNTDRMASQMAISDTTKNNNTDISTSKSDFEKEISEKQTIDVSFPQFLNKAAASYSTITSILSAINNDEQTNLIQPAKKIHHNYATDTWHSGVSTTDNSSRDSVSLKSNENTNKEESIRQIMPRLDSIIKKAIIIPDADRALKQTMRITDRHSRNEAAIQQSQADISGVTEELGGIGKKLDTLNRTVKNKTENHFHVRGPLEEYIKKTGDSWTKRLDW